MPMLRRDESPDPIGPHLLYLWQHKGWILIPALVVFALTYIAMRFVSEEFKATGALYVNRLMTAQERDEVLNPATVAQLLKSDMLLRQVRDEYMQTFNISRMSEFEKFARRFHVNTEILQDTSVRKDVSPVLELEVQSDGTSETRFLMESWIRHFMKLYGNIAADEAVQKRDNLLQEVRSVEAELQAAEEKKTSVDTKLSLQQKLLAQSMDILAPADLPQKPVQVSHPAATDLVDTRSGGESTVQVSVNSQNKPIGLLSRLADVKVQLMKGAGQSASTGTALLQSEAAAISAVIRDTETSISQLQITVAAMQREQERLDREIDYKRTTLDRLNVSLNRYSVAAAISKQAVENGMPVAGDVRAISMPVTPELRVWPKRTFIAAGAALAAMLFISVALLLHRYLQTLAIRNSRAIE